MKPKLIFFFCLFSLLAFGQEKNDTIYIKQQAEIYLTKMYVNKEYDNAASMWDSRVLLEMQDFYKKRRQGNLEGKKLYDRVKSDVMEYWTKISNFSLDKILKTSIESENDYKIGYVIFEYTQTQNGTAETKKTMLVILSEDKGKTWKIQDWRIKDILDKVDKNSR